MQIDTETRNESIILHDTASGNNKDCCSTEDSRFNVRKNARRHE